MSSEISEDACLSDILPVAKRKAAKARSTPKQRGQPSAPREIHDESTLQALAKPEKKAGLRPRMDENPGLLKDVVMGFKSDEPDPVQSGEADDRQSAEITRKFGGTPIAKKSREQYVWLAKAAMAEGATVDCFTMDADAMVPAVTYELKSENTCDVCGASCTEELYEFRCYERRQTGEYRRLHPFISYISKKCGKGLLGVQSVGAKLRERVFMHLLQESNTSEKFLEQATQKLESMQNELSPVMWRNLITELEHFAGASGKSSDLELKRAESQIEGVGSLHRIAEDPFRALSRGTAPVVNSRDLALATVMMIRKTEQQPRASSYLERAAKSIEAGTPLPSASFLAEEDVIECLQAISNVWPLNIELHTLTVSNESSNGRRIFVSQADSTKCKEVKDAVLKLVYLSGAKQLHASLQDKLEKSTKKDIREGGKELLKEASQKYGALRPAFDALSQGKRRAEDNNVKVPQDRPVSLNDVEDALLNIITWPDCKSRPNVAPDGADSIKAMCLGVIKPYFSGVCPSVNTKILPNLTRLCALLAQQIPEKDFKYSSIQLNMNYSAKLHVDKNNYGPSYIIGLGNYTKGELFIIDENGKEEFKVTTTLRGYPHIKVGDVVKGCHRDINHKWLKFNGHVPHGAKPFEGECRISLVYFSRKGSETLNADGRHFLEGLGLALPTDEWLAKITQEQSTMQPVQAVKRPRLDGEASTTSEMPTLEDSEDEVDEDEAAHRDADNEEGGLAGPRLRAADWARRFLEQMQVDWDKVPFSLGVSSCCAGPSAALALQELLPLRRPRVLAMVEAEASTRDAAVRLAKQNLQVDLAYKELIYFEKGKGFCEMRHEDNRQMPGAEEEDLLVGCFSVAPLLLHTGKKSYANDQSALPLKVLIQHLTTRRPRLALLEATDWARVHEGEQRGILDFLLKDGPEGWSLGQLKDFNVEALELSLADVGLPSSEARLQLLLARKDAVSPERLRQACNLARHLGAQLPRSSVQDLLLKDGDGNLEDVRRTWLRPPGAKPPPPGPYTDELRDAEAMSWWESATSDQKQFLNQVYKQAKATGLDIASLVVDMGQKTKNMPWSDSGLPCPVPGWAPTSQHFAFGRHRPLLGREELLCRGYPVDHLNLKGVGEAQLRALAYRLPALQVTAAALCGLLAAADWKGRARLQLPEGRFEMLAAQGAQLAASTRSLMAPAAPAADDSVTKVTNRAVVLLSLLNHRRLGSKDKDGSTGETTAAVPKKVVEALKNAIPEDEGPRGVAEAPPDLLAVKTDEDEEFRSWEVRRRKLNIWYNQRPPLPVDRVMRWVAEAALEPKTKFAEEILDKGMDYLERCMDASGVLPASTKTKKNQNSDCLDKELRNLSPLFLDNLLDSLEYAYGYEARISLLAGQATAILFLKCGKNKTNQTNRQMLLNGGMDMSDYVSKVMRRLDSPLVDARVNLEFLDQFALHFVSLSDKQKSEFADAHGFQALTNMLQTIATGWATYPEHAGTWSRGEDVLQRMLSSLPKVALRCKGLLRYVLQLVPLTKQQHVLAAHVEEVMCHVICQDLQTLQLDDAQIYSTLSDFKLAPGLVGSRIKATAGLLDHARGVASQLEKLDDDDPSTLPPHLLPNLEFGLARSCQLRNQEAMPHAVWAQLTAAENTAIHPVRSRLQSRKEEVNKAHFEKQREEAEQRNEQERKRVEGEKIQAVQIAQQAAERLRGLMEYTPDGVRLEQANTTGFEVFKKAAESCKKAESTCLFYGANPGESLAECMLMAKEASQHFCTRDARLARAEARLGELRFGKVLDLLKQGELLERLPELASPGGSQLLEGLGLPPKTRRLLLKSAQDGSFGQEHLTPVVPRGYIQKRSGTYGLDYLQSTQGSTWIWPVEPLPPVKKFSEPEAPLELPQARVGEDQATYIVPMSREGAKKARCVLCSCSATQEHLESGTHQHHLRIWRGFCSHVDCMAEDTESASYHAADALPLEAWKQELLESCQSNQQGSDFQRILKCFWHLIVKPNWPWHWSELTEALRKMSQMAQLEEPDLSLEPPKPGECFPCFPGPGPKITQETNIEALGAEDLLMYGLMLQANGNYRCWFCEVDVDNLEQHLNPHYKNAKHHHRYQQIWEEFGDWLRKDGWTLEAQGCTIAGQQYQCGCGAKPDSAYNLIGEGGHLRTNKHQAYQARLPRPSQDLEEKRCSSWTRKMEDNCRACLTDVIKQQKDLAKRFPAKKALPPAAAKAPKAAASAAAATSSLDKAQSQRQANGAASRSSESPVAAAATAASDASDEPPLPRPGKDFPDLSSGTGLEVRPNGTIWCHFCSYEVPNNEKVSHPQNRRHLSYRTAALDAFKMVKDRGHTLWREGQSLKDNKLVCECGKSADWWEITQWHQDGFHSKTKWHSSWARNYGQSLATPRPWEDARRQRWQQTWAQNIAGASAAAAAAGSAPISSDKEQQSRQETAGQPSSSAQVEAPPTKKARHEPPAVNTGSGGASSGDGSSGGSGGSSGNSTLRAQAAADTPVRSAPSAKDYPAPSEEDKKASQKNADNRYAPPLPAKELSWGYFDYKRKDFYVWCETCKTYVTCIKFNMNQGVASSEDGGSCPHYTPAVHAAYKDEMQKVLTKWGPK